MIDIKALEDEAKRELIDEVSKAARAKIKASLKAVSDAERILQNARIAHAALMRDISGEV